LQEIARRSSAGAARAIRKRGLGFAEAIRLAQTAYTYLRIARQLLNGA
jgi:hypothetical protein